MLGIVGAGLLVTEKLINIKPAFASEAEILQLLNETTFVSPLLLCQIHFYTQKCVSCGATPKKGVALQRNQIQQRL